MAVISWLPHLGHAFGATTRGFAITGEPTMLRVFSKRTWWPPCWHLLMPAAASTSLLPHFGHVLPSELSGAGVASRSAGDSSRTLMTGVGAPGFSFCSPVRSESNLSRSDNGPPPLDGSRFQ